MRNSGIYGILLILFCGNRHTCTNIHTHTHTHTHIHTHTHTHTQRERERGVQIYCVGIVILTLKYFSAETYERKLKEIAKFYEENGVCVCLCVLLHSCLCK